MVILMCSYGCKGDNAVRDAKGTGEASFAMQVISTKETRCIVQRKHTSHVCAVTMIHECERGTEDAQGDRCCAWLDISNF